MASLSIEQVKQIKEQLLQQVEKSVPEEKREEIMENIQEMDAEQLEEFLKKNNIQFQGTSESPCIFCSIVSKETPSYSIDENKNAIAVLEINPISKGHTLILPKKHIPSIDKIPKTAFTLAKKISKKLQKLNPKNVQIIPSILLGHSILNLLPVYNNENLKSPRKKAEEKELLELKSLLEKKSRAKTIGSPKVKKEKSDKLWLPQRLP